MLLVGPALGPLAQHNRVSVFQQLLPRPPSLTAGSNNHGILLFLGFIGVHYVISHVVTDHWQDVRPLRHGDQARRPGSILAHMRHSSRYVPGFYNLRKHAVS
jgi:hypothetical protein